MGEAGGLRAGSQLSTSLSGCNPPSSPFGFRVPAANPEISSCVLGVPTGHRPGQVCEGGPEARAGQDFWAGFGNLFGFPFFVVGFLKNSYYEDTGIFFSFFFLARWRV